MAEVLLTGAAGKTGQAVLRALARRGVQVRVLVRRREQARALQDLGATEALVGDLLEPGSLLRAMRGVRSVYHIPPNMHPEEVRIGLHVIGAARQAGVERLVYHSVLHPQAQAIPHHWKKLRVEEQLFESGLAFTVLQPAAYMQNLLAYRESVFQEGILRVPYSPEAPFSLVDLEDVAEAAARLLVEPGHEDAIYELAGPERLSLAQAAAVLSQVLGRPVRAERLSLRAWQAQARRGGLPPYARRALSAMFRYYDKYGLVGNPNALTWLLGRPPTDFATFARRAFPG